jgi:hypothetical protein
MIKMNNNSPVILSAAPAFGRGVEGSTECIPHEADTRHSRETMLIAVFRENDINEILLCEKK